MPLPRPRGRGQKGKATRSGSSAQQEMQSLNGEESLQDLEQATPMRTIWNDHALGNEAEDDNSEESEPEGGVVLPKRRAKPKGRAKVPI